MSAFAIPAYQPDLFCDRPTLNTIKEIINQVQSGSPHCPIVIQAGRGSGKTWLCLHLQRSELQGKEKITPLLIGLQQPVNLQAEKNEWFLSNEAAQELSQTPEKAATVEILLNDLLGKFAQDLGVWVGEQPTLGERSAWVINALQRTPDTTWVILVDSAFESDWALLDGLEKRLLAPVVTLPNVLILITGRGKPYPWQSPYLRTQIQMLSLDPLKEDEAKEQIEKFLNKGGIRIVKRSVFKQSQGHPLANILLAQDAKINDVIEELLAIIPEEQERQQIREFLEALCPLDSFVEGHLKPMLKAYYEYRQRPEDAQRYERLGRSELRQQVLDRMIAHSLVHWQDGGYQMDPYLLAYLRLYLSSEENHPMLEALRQAAQSVYVNWAKQFPKGSNDERYYLEQAQKFAQANQ